MKGADDENDLRSLCSMFTHSKNLSHFPLAEGSHSCLPSDRYLGSSSWQPATKSHFDRMVQIIQ